MHENASWHSVVKEILTWNQKGKKKRKNHALGTMAFSDLSQLCLTYFSGPSFKEGLDVIFLARTERLGEVSWPRSHS